MNHHTYYSASREHAYHKLFLWSMIWVLSLHQAFAQKKENTEKKEVISAAQMLEAESFFTEGMKYCMIEEYEKSIIPFEKALDLVPNNSGILYALSQAYHKLDQDERAIASLQKALAFAPENSVYAETLAELYANNKKYDESFKVYQQLIANNPQNSTYYLEQAALLMMANRYEEAIKSFDKAEKIMGINDEIIHQKQMVLLKNGKVDEAIKEGEKLIASDPDELEYLIDQAELLINNRRNEQAIPYVEKILKLNPSNAQAHVMLAQLYQEKGDLDQSNKELELAFSDPQLDATTKVRILMSYVTSMKDERSKATAFTLVKKLTLSNPSDPKGHAIYGDLLFQKGEIAEARNEYVKAARLDKSVHEVWGRIIQLDFDLNQIDSAIVHSEEAIEVFPNQAVFWYLNGSAYYRKRNHAKTAEALQEARRLAADGSDLLQHICAQLGDAYNSLGIHAKSDEAYDAALKVNPDNDHVLNNYSYFLSLRKERLSYAAEMANRLVQKHPNNGTYLDTYAWVLYEMKDYTNAKIYLEKAVANNINQSGTIVEHLGDVLFQLGDTQKAVEQWLKAKSIGGTSPLLEKKITEKKLIE